MFCVNVYITICSICLCLCGYIIKEFFFVYWRRPSPKSYQNLGFQVYDMHFLGEVGLYLFNCLIFMLFHSFIYTCFFS